MADQRSFDLSADISIPPLPDDRDEGGVAGVEVTLEPTRSGVVRLRLRIDRGAKLTRYVNRQGKTVYRWIFRRLVRGPVSSELLVDFIGEPVELESVRNLERDEVRVTIESLDEDARRDAIRRWFEEEARRIKGRTGVDRSSDGRLFFLELDRVSGLGVIRATLEPDEAAPDRIERRFDCIRLFSENVLRRRLYWRVRDSRVRFDDGPQPVADIELISGFMMPAFEQHLAGDDGRIDPKRVLRVFVEFAAGDYRIEGRDLHSNGYPNGSLFFYFAEFALMAARHEHRFQEAWRSVLGPLVMSQRVYLEAYGPPPIPFKEYGKRPRQCVPVERRERLVEGWQRQDGPDAWDRRISGNVWEASRGRWE